LENKVKKILIINGHPDSESFCWALTASYKKGAEAAGAEVFVLNIKDLVFNPNLQFCYRKRTELEPDLLMAQEKIKWAHHIVMVYPVWWGQVPGLMKGFLDRTFLPGFAFQKRENSVWWDKLLVGKTGRIISTLDQPAWYYWLIYRQPSTNAIKKLVFEFCGIKPVGTTTIGPIRLSKDGFRENWLKKVEKLGSKMY
jgi:NAD(P)H dehydrogenase (quinone)